MVQRALQFQCYFHLNEIRFFAWAQASHLSENQPKSISFFFFLLQRARSGELARLA